MRSEEVGVAHPPSYPLSETLTHAGQWISPSLSFARSIVLLSTLNFLLQYILVFCILYSIHLYFSPLFWERLSGSILCCCFRLVGGFLTVSSSRCTRAKGTFCLWITTLRDLRWILTFATQNSSKLIFKSVCLSSALQAHPCSMCGKLGSPGLWKTY